MSDCEHLLNKIAFVQAHAKEQSDLAARRIELARIERRLPDEHKHRAVHAAWTEVDVMISKTLGEVERAHRTATKEARRTAAERKRLKDAQKAQADQGVDDSIDD